MGNAPVIHGKGRITFQHFSYRLMPVTKIKIIPGGPEMDEDFIVEGEQILLDDRVELPPILITPENQLLMAFWIIDGRHRWSSYVGADRFWIPTIIGEGMKILD